MSYTPDAEQCVTSISTNVNGIYTMVVSNITYRSDGQIKTLAFNNGEMLSHTY